LVTYRYIGKGTYLNTYINHTGHDSEYIFRVGYIDVYANNKNCFATLLSSMVLTYFSDTTLTKVETIFWFTLELI